jgi:hypothetical protein
MKSCILMSAVFEYQKTNVIDPELYGVFGLESKVRAELFPSNHMPGTLEFFVERPFDELGHVFKITFLPLVHQSYIKISTERDLCTFKSIIFHLKIYIFEIDFRKSNLSK